MPIQIHVPAIMGRIDYTYSATGERLGANYYWHSVLSLDPVENANLPDYTMQNSVKTRAYAGNKIFEDGSLDKILLPNGYIQNNIYYFYLRDHLGSNCVTAKADGTVMQGLQYYPYGRVIEDESTGVSFQPYRYGGKEDEPMHGLGLLDFHARQLNHRGVPYTLTMDPLQEKYYSISPYSWCGGNPIRNVDFNGDTITTVIDGNEYIWGSVNGTYGFVGSDGALYAGKNSYAKNLTKALNSLRSQDVGKALVDYLAGDARSVNIVDGTKNRANSDGTTIEWNNSNSNPDFSRPGFIGLGHEMAHTQDVWNGTLDRTTWATYTDANGEIKKIPNAEKYALHVENQLRSEHRLRLRTRYALDTNTQFIQDGASMFHFRGTRATTSIVQGMPITTTIRLPFKY
jgi:RHS repeat-associated protein